MRSNPWNWQDSTAAAGPGRLGFQSGAAQDFPARRGQKSSAINHFVDTLLDRLAPCPWFDAASTHPDFQAPAVARRAPLYTPEERRRRDSTAWTMVQGVLAPIQFAIFLASLCLVVNYLLSGHGYALATASVIVKTLVLYTIMVTGSIWEKKVFGKYLFAPAFFWEDAVSMVVIALHTAYLAALLLGWGSATGLMLLALAAYATYAVNAAQFILKLRAARLEAPAGLAQGGIG
jgi:3-vinyl bacteriochlorophyllide hydratase